MGVRVGGTGGAAVVRCFGDLVLLGRPRRSGSQGDQAVMEDRHDRDADPDEQTDGKQEPCPAGDSCHEPINEHLQIILRDGS